MIHLHFDGLNHEWVVRYLLDGVVMQSFRTTDHAFLQKQLANFQTMEKGIACGKTFYTVPS